MMKKILVLSVLLHSMVFSAYADMEEKVTFSETGSREKVIETANFKIFLKLESIENGEAEIGFRLENDDDSKTLCIFDKPYSEDALDAQKIKYDKYFPGEKYNRKIEPCEYFRYSYLINPSKDVSTTITINVEDTTTVRIPIYLSELQTRRVIFCKKKEQVLMDKVVVELVMNIEQKTDETYLQLSKECDDLIAEYQGVTFCTNSRHKPSLEKQKANFQSKIDAIIGKINDAIESKGLFERDRLYKLFAELKTKLTSLNLTDKEGDCGRHKVSSTNSHRCNYCNKSVQQIYHRLDDIYQSIYSSQNRAEAKAKVMSEVKLMYNCAKRRSEWNNSGYSTKISKLYNGINNF